MIRHYRLFGFPISSELELPELPEQPAPALTEANSLAIRLSGDDPPGSFMLDIPGVARFAITPDTIRIHRAPGAGDRDVRLFLLGSAMGIALHQRGILPLHANAIAIDGSAVAFMGPSGAGKSTLAAWFHDRGFPVLADDVCVITAEPGGTPLAYPGLPRLRLWEDALEASGRSTSDHPPSFHAEGDERRKYDVAIPSADTAREPMPLAGLFVLREGPELQLHRLNGAEAMEAVAANTYRGAYIGQVGDSAAHFAACIELARKVPIFTLARPRDRAGFDEQCELILERCRDQLPSG